MEREPSENGEDSLRKFGDWAHGTPTALVHAPEDLQAK